MAEPDGAVELRGTVPHNGAVAKGDPELLFTQIEQTRADLARTIDTLADRVNPANNVQKVRARIAAQAAKPEVQLGAGAAGLAIAGLVVISILMRHRRRH
ncbi:MAG TPA: DUF3618 domain-containing protein [Streptosporangiaceae bacterium]|jgi:transcription initiation factor TFIIIB Brf1 subunit/transcription initiation factor TFIIB